MTELMIAVFFVFAFAYLGSAGSMSLLARIAAAFVIAYIAAYVLVAIVATLVDQIEHAPIALIVIGLIVAALAWPVIQWARRRFG